MSFVRCFVLFLSVTVSLCAVEKSPGIRLLDAVDYEHNSMLISKAVFKGVFEFMKIEGISEKTMTEISDEADRTFQKTSQDLDAKKKVAAIYEKRFTPEEMEELIRFYESPIGRKYIKVMSETTQEEEKIGKESFEKSAPDFEEKLEKIMLKALEEDVAEDGPSHDSEDSKIK